MSQENNIYEPYIIIICEGGLVNTVYIHKSPYIFHNYRPQVIYDDHGYNDDDPRNVQRIAEIAADPNFKEYIVPSYDPEHEATTE